MKDWLKRQLSRLGLGGESADLAMEAPEAPEPLSILLVDDAPTNIKILTETLRPMGYKLLAAKDGESALAIAKRARPALILLDVVMPEMDGYEVCRRLREDPEMSHVAVIFCSSLDDTQAKVKGLQLGAVDYITKPFEAEEVIARVGTHLAVQQLALSLQSRNKALQHELDVAREHQREAMRRLEVALLGQSSAIRAVRAAIDGFAAEPSPVLLSGVPSCGDEAVARAIHAASARRDRPFIFVDCSRLTPEEQAAALAERGGSKRALARGGTLYLAHVQSLASKAQDLLYALLSSDAPDTRVIAYASREGKLFPDGFTWPLQKLLTQNALRLPPLAERRDDVLQIAAEMLAEHARQLGKATTRIDTGSAARLRDHDWPGNLRELEDVMVRSLAGASGECLTVDPNLLGAGTPLGSYRLTERIGQGGMGEVWKAHHQLLARPAAIKLIRDESLRDPEVVARFRREATATAALASPHTVTLFDFGVSPDGDFYYVMELLDGIDLEALLERDGPIAPARLAHFLVGACKSLAEAHAVQMVHRDIKPSNLFACRMGLEEDVLKVLDFGLARQATPDGARLTQANQTFGTPYYMAPETATGNDVIDGRTDMYSLGATAYELLTGRHVFEATNPVQIMFKHVQDAPTPIRAHADVPEPLAGLVMRCLAKKLDERPTAVEMWTTLAESGLPQQWTPARAREWWAAR
jgi:DNA-binding NtrC family response regulator